MQIIYLFICKLKKTFTLIYTLFKKNQLILAQGHVQNIGGLETLNNNNCFGENINNYLIV